MNGAELIAQANRLLRATTRRPRQVDLKRAISAAYYAMFHTLAKECSDTVAGTGQHRTRAWVQAYRALEHAFAKNACKQVGARGFSALIQNFANHFISLQEARHAADYDPESSYTRAEAATFVANADLAIKDLKRAQKADRRAFVVLVLLKDRR